MRLIIRLFLTKTVGSMARPILSTAVKAKISTLLECDRSVGLSISVFGGITVRKHLPTVCVRDTRDLRERIPMGRPSVLGTCLTREQLGDHTPNNMSIYAVYSEAFNGTPKPLLFINLWCRAPTIFIPSFLVRAELTFTITNS